MIEEYGGVAQFSSLIVKSGINAFLAAEQALDEMALGVPTNLHSVSELCKKERDQTS